MAIKKALMWIPLSFYYCRTRKKGKGDGIMVVVDKKNKQLRHQCSCLLPNIINNLERFGSKPSVPSM